MHKDQWEALKTKIANGKSLSTKKGSWGGFPNSPWTEASAFLHELAYLERHNKHLPSSAQKNASLSQTNVGAS
jgi:hypothetical protein